MCPFNLLQTERLTHFVTWFGFVEAGSQAAGFHSRTSRSSTGDDDIFSKPSPKSTPLDHKTVRIHALHSNQCEII